MPGPNPAAGATLLRGQSSRSEVGSVRINPHDLSKAGAMKLDGGVLTVQNEKLAGLIHSKIAEASKLIPGGAAATDVDISVGVKVKG